MGESAHAPPNQNNNKRVERSWLADERSLALGVRTLLCCLLLLCVYKEGIFYPSHEPCPLSAPRNIRGRVILHAILRRVHAAKPGPSIASKPVLLCNVRSDWNSDATPINYNRKRRWNKVVHQANWKQDDRRVCVCVCARTRWREWLFIQFLKSGAPVKVWRFINKAPEESLAGGGKGGVGYIARIYPMNHACCSRWLRGWQSSHLCLHTYTFLNMLVNIKAYGAPADQS